MQILTRFEIKHKKGAMIFNTTDFNDLKFLDMPHDKEGFPGRHLAIGMEFNILENEQGEAGKYKVVGIHTFIQDDPKYGLLNSETYNWGLHITYIVERA